MPTHPQASQSFPLAKSPTGILVKSPAGTGQLVPYRHGGAMIRRRVS